MTDVYNGLRNNHLGAPGGYFGNALVVDVTDGPPRPWHCPSGCSATTSAEQAWESG